MMKRLFLPLMILSLAGATAVAADVERPVLAAPRVAAPSAIDGVLNDAAWEGAAAIDLDCVLGGAPAPGVSTRVLLARDDAWLYIAARCADSSGAIRAQKTNRGDPGVANDDSLEFFLGAPSAKTGKEYRYFHFMLGAGNAAREQKIEKGRMDPAWTTAWPAAARVTDAGWEAEAALPLAILAGGQLDGVVFNVTRNKQSPPARAYSWAVLEDGGGRAAYYNPAAFGRLAGLEDLKPPPMFAPVVLTAVNQGGYIEDRGAYCYAVSLSVTNTGDLAGTVAWTLDDRRLRDGARTAISGSAALGARAGTNLIISVPVDLPAARTAFVAIQPESAKRLEVGEMGRLCVLTAYTDRNMYHAADTRGRLTVGTVFTDGAFAREHLRLAVRLDGADAARPLFERQFDATANQGLSVEFKPAELPPGDYVFTVELSRAGTVFAGETTRFRAAGAPPAGCAVTRMDQDNLCLLVNDRPFFPLGFCNLGGYGNVLAFDDQAQCVMETNLLERFRAGGFNTIVEWGRNQTGRTRARRNEPWTADTDKLLAEDIRAALADFGAAGRHGLMIMPKTIGRLSYGHSSETVNRRDHGLVMEKLPQVMQPLSGLTNLLAWQGMDEMFGGIYELGEAHAALMHNLAPFTAIWASTRGFFPELLDFYDVPGVHGYWGPDSTPNHLATRIQGGTATAKLRRRPVFATPQGQRLTYRRELTPDERRCGIYLTLIQGAKGVVWFAYPHPFEIVHPMTWRVLAYTAREIGALAPVLLQNPPPQAVAEAAAPAGAAVSCPPLPPARTLFDPSYVSLRGPGKDAMPRIQALIHDQPGGGELILLANSGDEPVLLEAALSSLAAAPGKTPVRPAAVRGYFSGRQHDLRDGILRDRLEPYAVRVYAVSGSSRQPGAPVALGWRAVPESAADVATRQYYQALDRRVNLGAAYEKQESDDIYSPVDDAEQTLVRQRAGAVNLLENSSFEACALPGLPDNWMHNWIMRDFGARFMGGVTNAAYEGSYGIRLRYEKRARPTVCYRYWLDWKYGETYTLSAWMKAAGTGAVASLSVLPTDMEYDELQGLSTSAPAGPEWQRAVWTFTIPPEMQAKWRNEKRLCVGFRHADASTDAGDLLIDAVQLEKGGQATAYQRDGYHAPAVDPKWLSDEVFRELN